jgi:hypothetical protein
MIYTGWQREGIVHIFGDKPGFAACGEKWEGERDCAVSEPVFSNVRDPRCKKCVAALKRAKVKK